MRKVNNILIFVGFLWFGYGCQNNVQETKSEKITKSDSTLQQDGFIVSGEDFVITPTNRPEMNVLGKLYPNAKPEEIKTLIIGTAAELNQVIADSLRIMMGPIMVIYSNLPEKGVQNQIFVGIPINKTLNKAGLSSIKLKKGTYHKAKTMASLGQSAPFWTRVADKIKANGYQVNPPFIEYPSDTRTGEMTSVVTYSNLLIFEEKAP